MTKTKKQFTVKKQKDGDYEVTLHNQTRVFNLKEVMLSFMDVQKQLKQVEANMRLTKAVIQNMTDGKDGAVKMFKKLPARSRGAIISYIDGLNRLQKDETLYKDVKKQHDRLKTDLASIHAVIPKE